MPLCLASEKGKHFKVGPTGPRSRSQVPGPRSQVPGPRSQVTGHRFQVPGPRFQVPGPSYSASLRPWSFLGPMEPWAPCHPNTITEANNPDTAAKNKRQVRITRHLYYDYIRRRNHSLWLCSCETTNSLAQCFVDSGHGGSRSIAQSIASREHLRVH